jgi:hypothetical protein
MTSGLLGNDDGLVKATKLNQRRFPSQRTLGVAACQPSYAKSTFKAPERLLRLPHNSIDPSSNAMREMN